MSGSPYADRGLNRIPDTVSDEQAPVRGRPARYRILGCPYFEITEGDTVLVIGAGPTGLCTLLCVMLEEAEARHRLRKIRRKEPVS